eukprot:MONOS_5166.1-p1 / transcript=MONOS_5166.1 / gene=MONOS_5166 / organism=Monocercomonoides_exilis_PA203 / gene_product=Unconventional myosin tail / transcript_product=Unconventional myosin tail / location=Mono_scaffold00147:69954-71030(+) / protein_length=189 / sequence_SO=supercontig / SO=protein_coding / is_pseudo=false
MSSNPSDHPSTLPLFMGKKIRRSSSESKKPAGDLLNLHSNSNVMKFFSKTVKVFLGDTQVLFSDEVVKVNRKLKSQKRVFVVTDKGLYNLLPESFKCQRRIALDKLGGISMSCLTDNFFALHVPTEYDYLIVSSRKIEATIVMSEAFKRLTSHDLPVHFANTFEYRIDDKISKEIIFTEVDDSLLFSNV